MIHSDVAANITRFDVSTQGSVRVNDFAFAQSGHFKRTALGTKKQAIKLNRPPKTKVLKEFDIEFESVSFNLKDEVYKRLASMDVPSKTQVNDRVENKRYFVGPNKEISNISSLTQTMPKTKFTESYVSKTAVTLIVLIHLGIMWCIIKYLFNRRKLIVNNDGSGSS